MLLQQLWAHNYRQVGAGVSKVAGEEKGYWPLEEGMLAAESVYMGHGQLSVGILATRAVQMVLGSTLAVAGMDFKGQGELAAGIRWEERRPLK
ncbi:hypothetical protein AAC387_Pa09g0662 [Persea americana]